MDAAAEREWLRQWMAATPALEDQRRRELRALTPESLLAAIDALLALAPSVALSPERRAHSGLVEMQRILHRRRGR